MAPTFDLWQQAFTLASMSTAVAAQQGTPGVLAQRMNAAINTFLGQPETVSCLGQWTTVWGPAIFQKDPSGQSYADNAMYVAANADRSVYVVSTAGTNWNSSYDLHQDDLDVQSTVTWTAAFPSLQPYGVPASIAGAGTPCMSAGTANGVNALLGMIDGQQGTNQSLIAFLQALASGQAGRATLIFCGHSLAGALSPALALASFNPAGGKLTLSDWHAVHVYATAGITPGNAAFATCFSSVFPSIATTALPYQVWNMNVWNALDAVPHLWKIDAIGRIPMLYPASWTKPPIELTADVEHFEHLSEAGARTGAGPYEMIANQPLSGTYNATIPVSDVDSFRAQAYYQHTTAYDVLLNVQDLMPATANQRGFTPTVRAIVSGGKRQTSK